MVVTFNLSVPFSVAAPNDVLACAGRMNSWEGGAGPDRIAHATQGRRRTTDGVAIDGRQVACYIKNKYVCLAVNQRPPTPKPLVTCLHTHSLAFIHPLIHSAASRVRKSTMVRPGAVCANYTHVSRPAPLLTSSIVRSVVRVDASCVVFGCLRTQRVAWESNQICTTEPLVNDGQTDAGKDERRTGFWSVGYVMRERRQNTLRAYN